MKISHKLNKMIFPFVFPIIKNQTSMNLIIEELITQIMQLILLLHILGNLNLENSNNLKKVKKMLILIKLMTKKWKR